MSLKPLSIAAVALVLSASPGPAQTVSLAKAFPQLTFNTPVFLTHAGDGTDRIFVVQQDGNIIVFPNDSTVAAGKVFLHITQKLSAVSGEEGLLGLAFHPQYATNGYFYVNYTAPNPLRTVVARYRVLPSNPDRGDSTSEFKVIEINQPFTNHNGGMLSFGPDGYLYMGMGDGGSGNDPLGNGQSMTTLLGKMLRIDVNDTTLSRHYRIPPDNPFAGNSSGWREEIWALGMRNPWRWSFDPPTGTLWAGDVGQDTREEVDIIRKGGNYGWSIMEGTICRPPTTTCDTAGITLPIKDYTHALGIAVTGGYVYRGSRVPFLTGAYIYGDYGSGRIWMLRYSGGVLTADSLLLQAPFAVSSFGTDQSGELYVVSYSGQASIYRFRGNPQTSVGSSGVTPLRFSLAQNFPNPFNPSTSIVYETPGGGRVSLIVFDLLGRKVATLADGLQEGGSHTATFNAAGLASGVYFYRLSTPRGSLVRNMTLVR
ncbi:MAG TPA: PQQ-dependent sugar dehydrogenase [Bacteroidota bacterium]|nr:PQQ-dependent sugar dehydrogenase [Bacteroidota bacterium]